MDLALIKKTKPSTPEIDLRAQGKISMGTFLCLHKAQYNAMSTIAHPINAEAITRISIKAPRSGASITIKDFPPAVP
jgi:hypothetical protein